MTTTYLSKKVLAEEAKQAEDLDKLYKQMRKNSEANKLAESSIDSALERQYKPLISVISKQTEAIKSSDSKGDDERVRDLIIGLLADKDSERASYNIKLKEDVLTLNGMKVTISNGGKAITVGNVTYDLSPGLIHLLTSSNHSDTIKQDDVITYLRLVKYVGISLPARSNKLKLLKSLGATKYGKDNEWYVSGVKVSDNPLVSGNGLLPSNPLSLYKMLNLRLAAYKAGNKGLRNEVIAISDELLRQGVIKKGDYKKITMVVLN